MYNKSEICIGRERAGNKQFSDCDITSKLQAPFQICMVKVQYTNDHVMGIKIKYKGADGITILGQSSRKLRLFGVKRMKLKIQKDDYVREIFGCVDQDFINQIGFRTYKGDSIACGSQKGVAFSYSQENCTYVNASGSHSEFLEYLKFQVQPLTQIQINKLNMSNQLFQEDKMIIQ